MENRKDKRFGELDSVLIKAERQDLETATYGGINAYTQDISVSGARICSKIDFPVGYIIRIVIELNGPDQCLRVDGKVVWTRKSDKGRHFVIGVEFLHKFPATIISLIKHFYGKRVPIPSSVA